MQLPALRPVKVCKSIPVGLKESEAADKRKDDFPHLLAL